MYTFYCLIKTPGLIITPLFKRKFSDFENMLNNNPPLSTKNFSGNSYIFSCFSLGRSLTTFLCPKAPEIIIPDVPPIPTNPICLIILLNIN